MMGEKDCRERERGWTKKVVEIGYLIEQRNFRDISLRTNSSNVKPYTRLKYCATMHVSIVVGALYPHRVMSKYREQPLLM